MLKQRIETILNNNYSQVGIDPKDSKQDMDLKLIPDFNSSFEFLDNSSSCGPFSPSRQDKLCTLQAESKDGLGESSKTANSKANDTDNGTEKALQVQEMGISFTQALKDDHRAGLVELKAALNENRAKKIGELKTIRNELEEKGESVINIEKEIHMLTEGDASLYMC